MIYSLLVKTKAASVLIALKDPELKWHLSKIARETKTTYVFVTNIIKIFNEQGLVILETKGKKRIAKLTEKGLKIASLLDQLKEQAKLTYS